MKEKIMDVGVFGQGQPEIGSPSCSAEPQVPAEEVDGLPVGPHSLPPQDSQRSPSCGDSDCSSAQSLPQNYLKNLVPEIKQKKPNSLIRLAGFFCGRQLGPFAIGQAQHFKKLNKAQVEELYRNVQSSEIEPQMPEGAHNSSVRDGELGQLGEELPNKKPTKRRRSVPYSDLEQRVETGKRVGPNLGREKTDKMQELQDDSLEPAEQLDKQEVGLKRPKRRRQNTKKDKEGRNQCKGVKAGKKKDNISNIIFNAIEDYFN